MSAANQGALSSFATPVLAYFDAIPSVIAFTSSTTAQVVIGSAVIIITRTISIDKTLFFIFFNPFIVFTATMKKAAVILK